MIQFQVNLSEKSLENLTKQLNLYGEELIKAQRDVLEALADYVYEQIMIYVPVETGQLMESFIVEVSNDIAKVYTDLYYAKYVEFGTGVRGASKVYDTNYMPLKNYSQDYAGQIPQKFIYRAVQDLEYHYVEIARNVLREKGLI